MDPRADAAAALGPPAAEGEAWSAPACFAPSLAVFAGHFPGDPLVPGVHQVALVAELARRALGRPGLDIRRIARCKWLRPLRPGGALVVRAAWREADGGWQVDGSVLDGAAIACQVRLLLA
jgi:3-hydroxyacyl-[acyl-carrier-protein] dehydratase